MPRFAALPLFVCLLAPLASGCQTAQQTARVERPRGESFWSAEGRSSTSLVARQGDSKFRFASRDSSESGIAGFLSSGSDKERIPLPRTQPGSLRGVDQQASAAQGIGAF